MPNIEKLAARVAAVNNANVAGVTLYHTLAPIFAPLIGQQIIKADGYSFMQKYEKLLPKFDTGPDLRIYRHRADWALGWGISANAPIGSPVGPHTCVYHEIVVYIGELSNGVLTRMLPPFETRPVYTVEEVLAKREAFEKARKVFDEAKDALSPFGEHDTYA